MSKTRVWFMEKDKYGITAKKFHIDDPKHIPRIGEFVESNSASGWVDHVQYDYRLDDSEFALVIYVTLGGKE